MGSRREWYREGHNGNLWGAGNVLLLDLTGDYMEIFTLKKCTAVHFSAGMLQFKQFLIKVKFKKQRSKL